MQDVTVDDYGTIIVLTLEISFNQASIPVINTVWEEAIKKNPQVLAINFGNIDYIDSTAISTLNKYLKQSLAKKITFVLFNLTPHVSDILDMVNLKKFFTILTKEEFHKKYLKNLDR